MKKARRIFLITVLTFLLAFSMTLTGVAGHAAQAGEQSTDSLDSLISQLENLLELLEAKKAGQTTQTETASSEPETTVSEQKTTSSEPETTVSEQKTTSSEPETIASEQKTTSSEPETTASEQKTTSSEPETTASEPETTESETVPADLDKAAYDTAVSLYEAGQYKEALEAFRLLGDYKDSVGMALKIMTDPEYIKTAEEGDTICFGHYEQDNDEKDGAEYIEWVVIKKSNDRLLLMSKDILDKQKYNNDLVQVTWEETALRNWLNQDFLDKAFTDEEKAQILPTSLANATGNITVDNVWILSEEEIMLYLNGKEYITASSSETARFNEVKTDSKGKGDYWTRTAGHNVAIFENYSDSAVYVNAQGSIMTREKINTNSIGVRPAIWYDLGNGSMTDAEMEVLNYNTKPVIELIQQALNDQGYDCGWVDGMAGPNTSSQIAKFKADNGLASDSEINYQLVDLLEIKNEAFDSILESAGFPKYSVGMDTLNKEETDKKGASSDAIKEVKQNEKLKSFINSLLKARLTEYDYRDTERGDFAALTSIMRSWSGHEWENYPVAQPESMVTDPKNMFTHSNRFTVDAISWMNNNIFNAEAYSIVNFSNACEKELLESEYVNGNYFYEGMSGQPDKSDMFTYESAELRNGLYYITIAINPSYSVQGQSPANAYMIVRKVMLEEKEYWTLVSSSEFGFINPGADKTNIIRTPANQRITPVKYTVILNGGTSLRTGPGLSYGRILIIPEKEIVDTTYQAGNWVYTSYNGCNGWIELLDTEYFDPDKEIAPTELLKKPLNYIVKNTSGEGLELRKGPNAQYKSWGTVYDNTKITALAAEGSWVYTQYNGHNGWMNLAFLVDEREMSPDYWRSQVTKAFEYYFDSISYASVTQMSDTSNTYAFFKINYIGVDRYFSIEKKLPNKIWYSEKGFADDEENPELKIWEDEHALYSGYGDMYNAYMEAEKEKDPINKYLGYTYYGTDPWGNIVNVRIDSYSAGLLGYHYYTLIADNNMIIEDDFWTYVDSNYYGTFSIFQQCGITSDPQEFFEYQYNMAIQLIDDTIMLTYLSGMQRNYINGGGGGSGYGYDGSAANAYGQMVVLY